MKVIWVGKDEAYPIFFLYDREHPGTVKLELDASEILSMKIGLSYYKDIQKKLERLLGVKKEKKENEKQIKYPGNKEELSKEGVKMRVKKEEMK